MEVSLELVPRNREALEEGALIAKGFPGIGLINVPDLSRFTIRSWEACGMLGERNFSAALSQDPKAQKSRSAGALADAGKTPGRDFGFIPHLRARNFSPDEPFPLVSFFREQGISRALVIAGDPPAGTEAPQEGAAAYSAETIPFIKKLKRELPELEIFAAFDPYRNNIRYELDYLKAKEEAGASGFMSQPFFDLRLLEIYAEYLEGKQVFWGIAPVVSASNRLYWESRNRAVFPKQFRADLDWNVEYGRKVINFCKKYRFNLYLMPIKVDLRAYLSGLFG